MDYKAVPPVQSTFPGGTFMPRTNRARHSLIGRARLAIMEIVLCVVVPCAGLLIWLHFDQDFRSSLFSGLKPESPYPSNSVYGMAELDQDSVISVQTQGQIRVWDLARGVSTGEIQSRLTELRCVACSPHQRLLAVGSAEGYLEMWDLDHPSRPLASSPHTPRGVKVCQFTPDGTLLCSAGENADISIWDSLTLRLVGQLPGGDSPHVVRCLSFSADGRHLLAGDERGSVHVWDFATRRRVRTLQPADSAGQPSAERANHIVQAVLTLPGQGEVVVVTRARGISVWDIHSGQCLRRWDGEADGLHSATLSNNGAHIVTGSMNGKLTTWETSTGRRLRTTRPHQHIVRAVAGALAGTSVLSGDCLGGIECHQNTQP